MAQRTQPLQHLWEMQPDLGDIWNRSPPPSPPRVNLEWLASTETQDQLQTAQTLCLEHGNPAFEKKDRDRAIELLVVELKKESQLRQSARTMSSALLLLSDGSHAEFLWQISQRDSLMRSQVEKALVRWKSPVALSAWRDRLNAPNVRPTEIADALQGIAELGGPQDRALLENVLRGNRTTLANRLLAASALGQLIDNGLEELAQTVLSSDVEQRHLLAAHLLKRHASELSLEKLRLIYDDGSAVAQRIAARSICLFFPIAAREYGPQLIAHADPEVRKTALTFLQKQTDETSLTLQARLLQDRNLEVRRMAGRHLIEKANNGQRGVVDECITEHLHGDSHMGIEQAILVSVVLKDTTRCNRLVELLDHPREEVNMVAGWGLMEIAEEVAVLEKIHAHLKQVTEFLSIDGPVAPIRTTDLIRISYLSEALGRTGYEPAVETLMAYVPKNDFKLGIVSRASAIWALGQLYQDKDDAALRARLCKRIEDVPPINPEDNLVRFACALALGKMGYEDCISTLEQFNDGTASELGFACTWALEQIRKSAAKRK
ncbi:MAG: HEAT repeat domain-containing protein [Pirellula sp.]